jgi:S-adenosylmethionine:tRNA ribosyltransferase-isomerase
MNLETYNFHLPESAIAKKPVTPRDSAKLLVYNTTTNEISIDTFQNIDKYLPKDSFLVLNNTRVLPARLNVIKPTGGKATLLLLLNEIQPHDKTISALVDRKIVLGQNLAIDKKYVLTAVGQDKNIFTFKPNFSLSKLPKLLLKVGATPIPPYLSGSPLRESTLRERYQSIFANQKKSAQASVAAPTASLHFTPRVFKQLDRKGIERLEVTLHVGLGTFGPIGEDNFRRKKLFPEYFDITPSQAKAINNAKSVGKKLFAVGTTACRTIESAATKQRNQFSVQSGSGKTEIFIFPPYHFKMIDGLITNFHLPQSSLMLLVDALLKDKKAKMSILDLYQFAIKNNFRFYSYADAM